MASRGRGRVANHTSGRERQSPSSKKTHNQTLQAFVLRVRAADSTMVRTGMMRAEADTKLPRERSLRAPSRADANPSGAHSLQPSDKSTDQIAPVSTRRLCRHERNIHISVPEEASEVGDGVLRQLQARDAWKLGVKRWPSPPQRAGRRRREAAGGR